MNLIRDRRDKVVELDAHCTARPRHLYRQRLERAHHFHDPELGRLASMAYDLEAEGMPYAQYSEQALLNSMFGNCIGCVHTTIAAGTAAQTSIAGGTFASAGVTANWDTTPPSTAQVWTGTGGSGATKNQYTNPHAFQATASAASSITIASQTMSTALTVGDFVFTMGTTAAPIGAWTVNTLYIGLTTQAVSGATQANVLSNEPTSTGSYARIVVPNNALNWVSATAAQPSVLASNLSWSFPASGAAWSSGASNLIQMFIADASTLAGGNVLAYGALGTPQAVNASGITLSFAIGAVTITLT